MPILLIVYKKDNISEERLTGYKERIFVFASDIPNLNRLKVEFIAEENLSEFDVSKL